MPLVPFLVARTRSALKIAAQLSAFAKNKLEWVVIWSVFDTGLMTTIKTIWDSTLQVLHQIV